MPRFKELTREEIDILVSAIRMLRNRSPCSREKNIAGFMQRELMIGRIDANIAEDNRVGV